MESSVFGQITDLFIYWILITLLRGICIEIEGLYVGVCLFLQKMIICLFLVQTSEHGRAHEADASDAAGLQGNPRTAFNYNLLLEFCSL